MKESAEGVRAAPQVEAGHGRDAPGIGGQQILADKQFAIADVADDPSNCPAGPSGPPNTKNAIACVEADAALRRSRSASRSQPRSLGHRLR
ncbi:MAG: hypothetical protein R3B70_01965 [Polyangiaceae bacterium]